MPLFQVMLRLCDDFHSRLAPLGVTALEAGMMMYVHRHANVTTIGLAKALGMHELALVPRVEDLVRKGLVRRQSDRQHHGDSILSLTSEGKVTIPEIAKHILEISHLIQEVAVSKQKGLTP
jgi:DNA-binding MarR family transcriptional regulator